MMIIYLQSSCGPDYNVNHKYMIEEYKGKLEDLDEYIYNYLCKHPHQNGDLHIAIDGMGYKLENLEYLEKVFKQ